MQMSVFYWAGICWTTVRSRIQPSFSVTERLYCLLKRDTAAFVVLVASRVSVLVICYQFLYVQFCPIRFFSSFKMRIKWLRGHNAHISFIYCGSLLFLSYIRFIFFLLAQHLAKQSMECTSFPFTVLFFIVPLWQPWYQYNFFLHFFLWGENCQIIISIIIPTSLS